MFARYTRRSLAVALFLVAAALGSAGAVNASAAARPYCGITWGSLDKSARPRSETATTKERSSANAQHEDRSYRDRRHRL